MKPRRPTWRRGGGTAMKSTEAVKSTNDSSYLGEGESTAMKSTRESGSVHSAKEPMKSTPSFSTRPKDSPSARLRERRAVDVGHWTQSPEQQRNRRLQLLCAALAAAGDTDRQLRICRTYPQLLEPPAEEVGCSSRDRRKLTTLKRGLFLRRRLEEPYR